LKRFVLLMVLAISLLVPSFAFASGDKNCSDFSTWLAAQKYFESHGGSKLNNVDGLDRDHDGLACESLKGFHKGHKNPNDNPVPTPPKPEPKPQPKPTPQPTPDPDHSKPADNTKPGGKMPKTASPYANSMVIGSIMLLAGAFMLYRKKPTT
jgi:hypothetical protein